MARHNAQAKISLTEEVAQGGGGGTPKGLGDVTNEFAVRPNGRYEGLVTGLPDSPSVLMARLADGSGARLTVTNGSLAEQTRISCPVIHLAGRISGKTIDCSRQICTARETRR